MCLYPRLIKNKKYTATKKNGGVIPPVLDDRVLMIPVGCQECKECREQKARGWKLRLMEEVRQNKGAKFITLTFSNEAIRGYMKMKATKTWASLDGLEGYALDNEICTRAMRLFLERWRRKYKVSIRHWMVTELGHKNTENVHLHGIMWGDVNEIERIWNNGELKNGWVWKGKYNQWDENKPINYVNERTINYIVKYVNKIDKLHPGYKSIILTSPGMGRSYTEGYDAKKNKYNGVKTQETYRTRQGLKIAMPPYWRNKLYTEEEKEQLWLQKLDKQERWVLGQKVSIREGEEIYWKTLEWAQTINHELGYGTGEKNWEKAQYENELRTMKIMERVKTAMEKELEENKEEKKNNNKKKKK